MIQEGEDSRAGLLMGVKDDFALCAIGREEADTIVLT